MQVDYISDLHLDFHVRHDGNYPKWQLKTGLFLHSLLPNSLGEILILAGDISHYNIQSFWAIEYFSNLYNRVFYVSGNHDYYLISGGQRKKYRYNSKNREIELCEMVSELSNVTHLKNFETCEYQGFKIAGATSWYPLTDFKDRIFFEQMSNDSVLIKKIDIGAENYIESEKYKDMEQVDIIITHVPPTIINSHHKHGGTSCYLNELKDIKADHMIFGHCHEQECYDKVGFKFYINALGYPNEWVNNMAWDKYSKDDRVEFKNAWHKIKSFNLEKAID